MRQALASLWRVQNFFPNRFGNTFSLSQLCCLQALASDGVVRQLGASNNCTLKNWEGNFKNWGTAKKSLGKYDKLGEVSYRGFIGGVLSDDVAKKYSEKRLLGYSRDQLFSVVSAVEHYQEFVPWCVKSTIIKHSEKNYIEAELEVGFQLFVERYISRVTLDPPKSVHTSTQESTLFHHLESEWKFEQGPTDASCWITFEVDFAFKSELYRQVATVFFEEVVKRMMAAFESRCSVMYGPSSMMRKNNNNNNKAVNR